MVEEFRVTESDRSYLPVYRMALQLDSFTENKLLEESGSTPRQVTLLINALYEDRSLVKEGDTFTLTSEGQTLLRDEIDRITMSGVETPHL